MEMIKFEVTEATEEDLDAIYDVDRRAFEYPMSRSSIERDLRDRRLSKYFVARISPYDQVVGYIGLWCIFPEAHIVSIAVDPDYQGKGIGNKLLEQAISWLIGSGFKHVFLEVRVDNEVAINLYNKHGFEKVSVRKNYYQDGSDAYVMVKDLTRKIEQ